MRLSMKERAGIAVALLALLAAPAVGQYDSGSYYFGFGNNKLGGSVEAYGYMQHTSSSSTSYGRVTGYVRLLGYTKEAGRVTASGYQSYGSGNGSVAVRIGGNTIWSSSLYTSGSRSYSNVLSAFNPSPSATYWVGPVPVTVTGNVGAGASLGINWALVASTLSAGLNGQAHTWGYGWASAGVGVPGYNVSLQLALNFANQYLNYGLNANLWGINGYLSYSRLPMSLMLNLIVTAWPFSWTNNLATYYYGSTSIWNIL